MLELATQGDKLEAEKKEKNEFIQNQEAMSHKNLSKHMAAFCLLIMWSKH